jgi:hypothetical protein
LNKLFQRIKIISSVAPEIIMAVLCDATGTCTNNDVISARTIIGIIIGALIGLSAIITVLIIISILCKKKKQPSVLWVQSAIYHTPVGYNESMNMGSCPTYGQSFGYDVPPPAYQQENIPVVSSKKVEA